MFHIDNDSAALAMPVPTSAGTPGYFTDGNPATGLAATVMPAEFMNMIMMELANLVTSAGLTLSKSDYTQVSQAVTAMIGTLGTVTWANVTNKPTNIVTAETTPWLTAMELSSAAPYIDFHYGQSTADYNVRVVNDADGQLTISNGAGTLATFSNAGLKLTGPLAVAGVSNFAGLITAGAATFNSAVIANSTFAANSLSVTTGATVGGALEVKGATTLDTTLTVVGAATLSSTLAVTGGATLASTLSVTGAVTLASTLKVTGAATFTVRPTFAGYTPWDTGNFNPALYQAALGYTPVRQGGGISQLANLVFIGYDGSQPRITIDSTDFGQIVTSVNYTAFVQQGSINGGYGSIGSYCLAMYIPGTAVDAGATVAGSNLRPSPTAGNSGSTPVVLTGTWKVMGWVGGASNVTQSTTLFQRIA